MVAPVTAADAADVPGQANSYGPSQASVYGGPTSDPLVSLRTLATLLGGETPVIGARRIDHANMTDYGFGAEGIEYLLTTSAGALIPDVAGLTEVRVLDNDDPGGTASGEEIDPASLTITAAPAHGAAAVVAGSVWYAPVAGYDGADTFDYEVDNEDAETSSEATATLTVAPAAGVNMAPYSTVAARGTTITIDPALAFLVQDGEPGVIVQDVEITSAPAPGSASVVLRKADYVAPTDFVGLDTFSWRTLVNGVWGTPQPVEINVGRRFRKAARTNWPREVRPPTEQLPDPPEIEARPDEAITDFETAVMIDLLGNDVGSNLSVLSLNNPTNGSVINNGDGTVTYTPEDGFDGEDTFAYVITDGVRTAGGTVRVQVNVPPTDAFANDYEAMGQIYALAQSESMPAFPLLIDYTDPRLRTQANGGVVRSASGHDIRLEQGAGSPLEYKRILYNGSTGRILAVVKRSLHNVDRLIEIFAGKQGSVVDEENEDALDGHFFYCRADTGADLTGNGRNLTVSGAVATTLFGCPAATFDGVNDGISLADPSAWLDGVSAYTLLMDLQHGQTGADAGIFRIGGTATGSDSAAFLAVRATPASYYAAPAVQNLYYSLQKTLVAAVETNCRIEGEDGRVFAGVPTCFARAWASGEDPRFVSHGSVETPAYVDPAAPVGTLVASGGPLAFAAGPRAYAPGIMGLVRMSTSRRSNAWIVAEQRNRIDYRGVVASGAMRNPNQTAPCIAFPVNGNLTASAQTFTPLSIATGTGLKIVAATASLGSASINTAGTQITYTPPATAPTVAATISFTIRDSLNRESVSRIRLEPTPFVSIAANFGALAEGNSGTTAITFRVRRTGNLAVASSVSWSVDTTVANPVSASDFVGGVLPSGSVSWTANETADKTITCNIAGDVTVEADETLRVVLSSPMNCRLATESTATTIVLNDDGSPPAEDEIPDALRTITVATAAELSAVLTASSGSFPESVEVTGSDRSAPLVDGDHVACLPGTYAGTFTLSRSGTGNSTTGVPTNPIYIKSASGTVTFTGRLNLNGNWNGAHRLRFTGGGVADADKRCVVDVRGRGTRVTRCLFDGNNIGGDGILYLSPRTGSHPQVEIDHNEWRDIQGAAIRCELNESLDHKSMRIHHNFFNGHTVQQSSSSTANESVCLFLADEFDDIDLIYEKNLFRNCMRDPGGFRKEGEIASLKTGGVTVRNNTFDTCDGGFISIRTANRCIVEDNWLDDGAYIKVRCDDHIIRNNKANPSSAKVIDLMAGDSYSTPTYPAVCNSHSGRGRFTLIDKSGTCKAAFGTARRITIQDNIGDINVGVDSKGVKARDITIDRHTGTVAVTSSAIVADTVTVNGSIQNSGTSNPSNAVNTAVKLTSADVGPDAP